MQISNKDARLLLLNRQGLASPTSGVFNADKLQSLIYQLGYVQLDSINTVERAHHMILHSRADGYQHKHLKELHEQHQSLFEHWTHDACLIPSEFYSHWRHRFNAAKQKSASPHWQKRLGPDGPKIVSAVKSRIKKQGPLMSRDFDDKAEDKGHGGWWGWGASKTALEYLWRTGELAVARREGFQKVYDLSERVIDISHRAPKPSLHETIDWKCRQALLRLGCATPAEIAAYWASVSVKQANDWVKHGLKQDLIQVQVETASGAYKSAVAFETIEQDISELKIPPKQLRFLSPFDPLIRDRKRLERLFAFDYLVEIFVPEAKRQYGYYVLPILEGARFTGRADLKVHRKEGRLEMKGLWLEDDVVLNVTRKRAIAKALKRLAVFTGAATVDTQALLK